MDDIREIDLGIEDIRVEVQIAYDKGHIDAVRIHSGGMRHKHGGGLCGYFTGDCFDDFRQPHGAIFPRNMPCDELEDPDPDPFSNDWKSTSKRCSLHKPPDNTYQCTMTYKDEDMNMEQKQFCLCTHDLGSVECLNAQPRNSDQCKGPIVPGNPEDNECDFNEDIDSMLCPATTLGKEQRPFKNISRSWSENDASEYCTDMLMNSPTGQVCSNISGVDVHSALKSCIADIMFTDSTDYAGVPVMILKSRCMDQARKTIRLWTTESTEPGGIHKLPEFITEQCCPADCSGHGKCETGTCHCANGFAGGDCSIDLNTPPSVLGPSGGGLCDRTSRPCEEVTVMGSGFARSENLTCHVQLAKVTDQGTEVSPDVVHSLARYISRGAASCILPPWEDLENVSLIDPSLSLKAVSLSVSNNGQDKSSEHLVILLDPSCETCNVTNGTCNIRNGTCRIEEVCFMEREVNNLDHCQICDPYESVGSWSHNPDTCQIEHQCVPRDGIHEGKPCLLCNPENDFWNWSSNPDMCHIDSMCYADGDVNELDPCSTCDPAQNIHNWSHNPQMCKIDELCISGGDVSATDQCDVCNPDLNIGDWSHNPDTCRIDDNCVLNGDLQEGDLCSICDPETDIGNWTHNPMSCKIHNACFMEMDVNPYNECELCNPSENTDDWTVNTDCGEQHIWPFIAVGLCTGIMAMGVTSVCVIYSRKTKRTRQVHPLSSETANIAETDA